MPDSKTIQSSRERSLEKGRARFRALIENSGGLLTESEVAVRIGKSPYVIREWVSAIDVITLADDDGQRRYPAFQFGENGLIDGIREILEILYRSQNSKNCNSCCVFLLTHEADFQGLTHLAALSHEAYRPLVFRAARQYGIQGAL